MLLTELRERVCAANKALPQHGLVTMTSGNVQWSGYRIGSRGDQAQWATL